MVMGKELRYMLLLAAMVFGTSIWASVPPPPVNQNIGFPDRIMNNISWDVCLSCHGDPGGAPVPVKSGYLPDRHHLRVDTPIEEYSASPFPEKSPDGTHKCTTCHLVDWIADPSRPLGGYFAFAQDPAGPAFRNCLNCHKQVANVASVHHLTQKAQDAKCHLCHGNVINNPNDDHYIPDTGVVNVTPRPGRGSGEVGVTGEKIGGCRYCHGGGVDDATGIVVPVNDRGNANNATHHGTGIARGGTNSVHTCLLCHNWGLEPGPLNGPYNIRGCERCHGISSLHNIQFDAVGDGIVPGEEEPFYGHVGNNLDCRGCHGPNPTFPQFPYPGDPEFDHLGEQSDCLGCHRNGSFNGASGLFAASTAGEPAFGPVIPYITGVSDKRITTGRAVTLTLTGSGFYAAGDRVDIPARVALLSDRGPTIEITPTVVTPTLMEVNLPADLAPGAWGIKAVKNAMGSNIINLVVLPVVAVNDISCSDSKVTITGTGFGSYLDAENSGTAVSIKATGEKCRVDSWQDNQIVANCAPADAGVIEVQGIFGSSSASVACSASNEEGGRPKWWSIWSWWSSWSWSRR